MKRRSFITATAVASASSAAAFLHRGGAVAATNGTESVSELHTGWRDFVPEGAQIADNLDPIDRDPKQWRESIDDELAWRVLFREATERAFTSPLNDEKRKGVFVCKACNLPLFTSSMKFDSGTGWPSFFTAIPGHVSTKTDYKLILPRTEYHCAKCGGHQGHVFADGPAPTGQRYCNNGVALRFLPLD